MIMNRRKAHFETFRLALCITVKELHVKSTGFFCLLYMTFLTAAENLKIGETASHLSSQRFMEFGYLCLHFSLALSSASRAFASSGA